MSEDPAEPPANGRRPLWNSLEAAKLLASVLTPAALLFLGYQISERSREIDSKSEEIEKIQAKRADIWDKLSVEIDGTWAIINNSYVHKAPLDYVKVITSLNKSLTLVSSHDPYFSQNFCKEFWSYSLKANNSALEIKELGKKPFDRRLMRSAGNAVDIAHDALMSLRRAAAEEISPLNKSGLNKHHCSFFSDQLERDDKVAFPKK